MFDRIASEVSVGSLEHDILVELDDTAEDFRTSYVAQENAIGRTKTTTLHVSARRGRLQAQADYEGRIEW